MQINCCVNLLVPVNKEIGSAVQKTCPPRLSNHAKNCRRNSMMMMPILQSQPNGEDDEIDISTTTKTSLSPLHKYRSPFRILSLVKMFPINRTSIKNPQFKPFPKTGQSTCFGYTKPAPKDTPQKISVLDIQRKSRITRTQKIWNSF